MIKTVIVMKKLLSAMLALLCLSLCSCALKTDNKSTEKLTFYILKENVWEDGYSFYNPLTEIIKHYNKQSGVTGTPYEIEIVEFDSTKLMFEKMSTEIMAGGGPDVFSIDYNLPFEKLIRNGAFADINEINDGSVCFDEYNPAVVNVGVFDGKRYIVPVFYKPRILRTGTRIADTFNLPKTQGATITYDDIDEVFKSYFADPQGFDFIYAADFFTSNAKPFIYDYIASCINFDEGKAYFDTPQFRKNIESIKNIISHSSDSYEIFDDGVECKQLFEGWMNLKVTDAQQLGRSKKSQQDDKNIIGDMLIKEYKPIVYNAITNDKNTFSANIECAVAVNANSDKKDKAFAFIKYLLSEDAQEYWCGDKDGSNYGGSNMITLPVNKKAFTHHLEKALEITDEYGSVIGSDNEFNAFAKAYQKIIGNINDVSLYYNTANSYYSKNVIGDIVAKYLNNEISQDKFIRQLTAATEIYLTE